MLAHYTKMVYATNAPWQYIYCHYQDFLIYISRVIIVRTAMLADVLFSRTMIGIEAHLPPPPCLWFLDASFSTDFLEYLCSTQHNAPHAHSDITARALAFAHLIRSHMRRDDFFPIRKSRMTSSPRDATFGSPSHYRCNRCLRALIGTVRTQHAWKHRFEPLLNFKRSSLLETAYIGPRRRHYFW